MTYFIRSLLVYGSSQLSAIAATFWHCSTYVSANFLGDNWSFVLAICSKLILIVILYLSLNATAFVLLHTVPVLYEKYEDKVDPLAEKLMQEIKKQYAIFDAKVLSKIPVGPLKDKKNT